MASLKNQLKSHPDWSAVESIYHTLQSHGYKAFLAGGCVRDALLGRMANDLDVATDATPEQIEQLFPKTVNVGKAFGVMRVLNQNADIEVATFRLDGRYEDGRRPESVEFSSPEEDAKRRDFTVNALFYDLENDQVIDYVKGQSDLSLKIIRTVGDSERRFTEDHLRLLRAARFVGQLDFTLDPGTFKAIKAMASLVKTVSGERLRDEMYKLLRSPASDKSIEVMKASGMMEQLFPFYVNKSWKIVSEELQVWQYFALFFRSAALTDLESGFALLKLSNKEKKNIEQAWQVFNNPDSFLNLSLGQKLKQLPKEGLVWALSLMGQENPQLHAQLTAIQAKWAHWGAELPKPFLKGDDVGAALSGKSIGVALEKAYELQLEETFSNRDSALVWLREYLKKEVR